MTIASHQEKVCNMEKKRLTSSSRYNFVIVVLAASISSEILHLNPSTRFSVQGFTQPVFVNEKSSVKTSSKNNGEKIEMPNFDELFDRIQQISPLAKLAVEGRDGGFLVADDEWPPSMKWKTIEKNAKKPVQQIDKIDNFQNLGTPLVRWRSSMKGPLVGERFANFIMTLEERKKWDVQIHEVTEQYPVSDLKEATRIMGDGKYGESLRLGIGYCRTKANIVVSPREQLTLCGIQEFDNGACIIWGVEMEDRHDHLLPKEWDRCTRGRTQIFSTALVPTGPDSFDVEYVLQMDVGGRLPVWMTTPVISETVKSLFKCAESYFGEGPGGELDKFIKAKQSLEDALA